MAREVIVERDVVPVESGDSTASNAIWAVALLIIVAMVVGVVYYSGILRRVPAATEHKINVEVKN